MKAMRLAYVLFFVFLTSACAGGAVDHNSNLAGKSANSLASGTDDKQDQELRNQIERIAAVSKGRVGVAATVLETGETVSFNPQEHFPMQSVYKFPIGMAVLRQVDAGKLKLDQKVRVEKNEFISKSQHSPIRDKYPNGTELTVAEVLRYAVSESDGTASDVLLRLAGGVEEVDRYLKGLGVNELVVANTEMEIGRDWETQYRNWASPESAVALLRALHERRGLSEQSQALLLKLMTETPTGMKRLKGLLPKDAVVAHKTGTSGNREGITAATNDIGIVTMPDGRHVAIAVFVSDSPADEATREEVIAKIAKAVWDKWSS